MKTSLIHVIKSVFAVLILIVSLSTAGYSQTSSKSPIYGGYFAIPFEFSFIDVSEANDKFKGAGLPDLDYPKIIPGFGFQFFLDGFVLQFSAHKRTKVTKTPNETTSIAYKSIGGGIGHTIFQNAKFALYPFIGYKNVQLDYKTRSAFRSFYYDSFTYSRSFIDLGFGLSNHNIHLFDIRFGYYVPFGGDGKIKINERSSKIYKSPELYQKFYLTLTVGIGKTGRINKNVQ